MHQQYAEVETPIPYPIPGQQPGLPPDFDRDYDQVERYGSIIKDLTDTEKLLKDYELRLMGMKLDDNDEIVKDTSIEPRIKDIQTAKDFVEAIRSVANQNTHFTGYKENDILNSLNVFNYTMTRWMMFQGENIPLRYRQKMCMEAMNIIKASLHKAKNALIAKWSKGSISEEQHVSNNNQGGGTGMFPFNMFNKRGR